jgi:RimJ/RimL family protein N-acetyltransferase
MSADHRLRPVESEDVAPLARMLAHPSLVGRRGLHDDRPVLRSVASISKTVESLVDPEHGDAWIVDADAIVGLATAGWWWDALIPWANVVIDPDRQRHGHGTAAARLVIDHLFENTPALAVEYAVPSWDADALSFADSLGGDRTGIRRRDGARRGRYFDGIHFALTRSTWEARHAAGR